MFRCYTMVRSWQLCDKTEWHQKVVQCFHDKVCATQRVHLWDAATTQFINIHNQLVSTIINLFATHVDKFCADALRHYLAEVLQSNLQMVKANTLMCEKSHMLTIRCLVSAKGSSIVQIPFQTSENEPWATGESPIRTTWSVKSITETQPFTTKVFVTCSWVAFCWQRCIKRL